jgi:hypothetical protein
MNKFECEKGIKSRRRKCLFENKKTNSFKCNGPSFIISSFDKTECNYYECNFFRIYIVIKNVILQCFIKI